MRITKTLTPSWRVGLALCLLMASAGACKTNRQAEVAGVWIPQAEGTIKAPKGPNVAINTDTTLDPLPADASIRLAVAREVRWSVVRDLRERILAAGKTPYLLVANDRKVGAIELYDTLEGEAINVYVSFGGKLCVSPPRTREAKCVKPAAGIHVDRAFTRELVREAVNAYGLRDILVDVPADLEWADVVRAVDGARTCFFYDKKEAKVRVRLK